MQPNASRHMSKGGGHKCIFAIADCCMGCNARKKYSKVGRKEKARLISFRLAVVCLRLRFDLVVKADIFLDFLVRLLLHVADLSGTLHEADLRNDLPVKTPFLTEVFQGIWPQYLDQHFDFGEVGGDVLEATALGFGPLVGHEVYGHP